MLRSVGLDGRRAPVEENYRQSALPMREEHLGSDNSSVDHYENIPSATSAIPAAIFYRTISIKESCTNKYVMSPSVQQTELGKKVFGVTF